MIRKVGLLRNGGNVKRWHTHPLIGEQTDAAHSWGVASLYLLLCPEPTMTLLKAMMWHDMAEQEVGDTSSPALMRNPALGTAYVEAEKKYLEAKFGLVVGMLAREERAWLDGCDKLECFLFCREQLFLGNRYCQDDYDHLLLWFNERRNELPAAIVDVVVTIWNRDHSEVASMQHIFDLRTA